DAENGIRGDLVTGVQTCALPICKGNEDAVVAPQVPGGGLVGQAVLGDHADGQLLDAAGVMALGPGQIGQIDGEVTVAAAAVMLESGRAPGRERGDDAGEGVECA